MTTHALPRPQFFPAAIAWLAFSAATLTAQQTDASPEPTFLSSTAPALRTAVLHDDAVDGSHWVKARRYKAHFDQGVVTWLPLLGPAAPSMPLQFRLITCAIGSHHLNLAASPLVQRNGDHLTIDHGAVMERWHLGLEQAEQDFVIDAAGATDDLLLRIAVAQAPSEPQRHMEGGLWFPMAAFGGVRYSDAVVLDAAGHRCSVPSTWVAGAIELRVPATFLRSATGPIVVDPWISTVTLDGSSGVQQNVDASFENGVWLAVYEEVASNNDTDIIERRFRADGSFLDEAAVDISNDDCLEPAVAANGEADQFLVVFHQRGLVERIKGRPRSATSTAQGAAFTIHSAAFSLVRPDIGGSPNAGVNRYYVVWTTNTLNFTGIEGCVVTTSSAVGTINNLASTTANEQQPAICKSSGPGRHWLVSYSRNTSSSFDILGVLLNENGQVVSNLNIDISTATDVRSDVAGDGNEFMVVWQRTGSPGRVIARRFARNGTLVDRFGALDLSTLQAGTQTRTQDHARVGCFGDRFVYSYRETTATLGSFIVLAAVVNGSSTFEHLESRIGLFSSASALDTGGIAGEGDAGPAGVPGEALVTSANGNVFGSRVALFGNGGIVRRQTGCGNFAEPAVVITDQPFPGHRMTFGAAFNQGLGAINLIGLPAASSVALCPAGCTIGVDPILSSTFAAPIVLLIPNGTSMIGVTLAVQSFVFGATGIQFCPANVFGTPFRTSDTFLVTVQ